MITNNGSIDHFIHILTENTNKSFVDRYFDDIMRYGEFSDHGSSLDEFLYDFDDDPWWDESKTHDDILNDETFRTKFREWLARRFKYAYRLLKHEIKANGGFPLTVYRSLVVPKSYDPSKSGTGVFWSLRPDTYPMQGKQANPDDVMVLLSTTISSRDVDWEGTMRSRMDYMHGDNESEIRLKPSAMIDVVMQTEGPNTHPIEYKNVRVG